MSETSRHDSWKAGNNYDAYMGRWSRQAARRFVDWLDVPEGRDWLDVGCGTGSLSVAILERANPQDVIGIDASDGFVHHATHTVDDHRATFRQGDAQALTLPDASRDAVVSGLVLNFVPDRRAMLSEMTRVAKPGGMCGFFVWDYPGGGVEFIDAFWRAASAMDPGSLELAEGRRFSDCTEDALSALASEVWGVPVEATALDVPTRFRDFEDFWTPFTLGAGPAPGYCVSLASERRERLREKLERDLGRGVDGSIDLSARALAVKAIRNG